ncbi:major facilitator superfamily domain-containing protein [Cercophora newfieldiana]|uniref:Major facilitator superfamily domain-containing protein n=1 Tax=Cercophora newfieldiana TaxID=92897 RepID=A0AA40CSB0_9PEZI|nr:major facilitator superfamily domain-containing protein [Cercophora newfieldiana]
MGSNKLAPTAAETPFTPDMSSSTTPAMSIAPTIDKSAEASDLEKAAEQKSPRRSSDTLQSSSETGTRSIRGIKWLLVCISLYVTAFLYGLDTTIAADVQGPVVEAFGHIEQLSWIGSGFPLGSVAVILLLGNLLNNFNMKWVFVGGVAMFEIGSAVCGAAPNMNALIVGRVLAGAGGSGVYLGALNYFSYLTMPNERGLYITLIGFFWGVGAVLGPIIGGAFAESNATWRWAFYINLVIGAVVAPIFLFYLPPIHPVQGKSIRERLYNLDILGLTLVAASWVMFTVAFSFAGIQWAWSDGRSIALVVVFGVLLIASILQQYFTVFTSKATRAVPGHLLPSRTQMLLVIATGCATATLFVTVYYIPIYFQFVHNDGPIQAAIRLLPYIIIMVTTNVAAGKFLSTIRYYMPIYVLAGVLITVGGSLLVVYLDPSTSQSVIYGLSVIVAVGTGLTIQLGYAVATLTVAASDIGNAISLQNLGQIGGSTVVLVISGQVFQSYAVRNLTAALAGHGLSAAEIISVTAGAQSEVFKTLSPELKVAASGAIVHAMQRSFALVISSGAIMIAAGLGMKREKLFGEVITA